MCRRQERTIVRGPSLAEAIEVPVSDDDIRDMSYRDVLKWAADAEGFLVEARLQRIGAARGYKAAWAFYKRGLTLDEALRQYEEYRRTRREVARWRTDQTSTTNLDAALEYAAQDSSVSV